MNKGNIINEAAETLTDKGYTLTIPYTKLTLLDRLLRRKSQKTIREFTITPCKVGNMYRISGLANLMNGELNEESINAALMPMLSTHLPLIVRIVAIAIQNDHREPSPRLIKFIEQHFDQYQIFEALDAAIGGLGLEAFLSSIVLVKGTANLMKPTTSPVDGRE